MIFFLFSSYSPAFVKEAKLNPYDDAVRDPSFFIFRARLLEAIQQRDAQFVVSILSPNIKNSFGGNDGISEFQKYWKLERPDSKFWKTMIRVLALGGSFNEETTFMAPYTYSKFPDEFDAFEHGVVIGENVKVRKEPKLDGQIIGTLSYDIVKVTEWKPINEAGKKQAWVTVLLTGNARGYIAEDYIRSPIDYRAIFEKKNGKWQLTAFVSGD
ncbi:MAG TPA: SH3 domain-containing protein [Blastocatellia bacterium]|nr:SH3 domain-containing protein [Blastocatellia bacterium]